VAPICQRRPALALAQHNPTRARAMTPLISVIVPIYRTEPYLDRCLGSILAQSFQAFEVLCIDDGSPDRSAEIVQTFVARDARVHVIRHERNLGLSEARNTGIRHARAPYVAGVDSDDHIRPDMLRRLWEATEGQTVDVVECGFEQVDEQAKVTGRFAPQVRRIDNRTHVVDIFLDLKNAFWNKLWRRSLFTEHGIWFPSGLHYEDLATSPRLLAFAKDIRTIPDVLYQYVTRPASIMAMSGADFVLDYFRCFELLADFLLAQGLTERYLPSLYRCLGANLYHHAEIVLASDMDEVSKDQYLRQLLILKLGFVQHHARLRGRHGPELLELLRAN